MRVLFRLIQKQFGNRLDCSFPILRLRRAKVQIHYLSALFFGFVFQLWGRAQAWCPPRADLTVADAALSSAHEICFNVHFGVFATGGFRL